LSKRRSELLPKILREWNSTDLREHLSRESRPIIQARIKKLESVRKRAERLLEALNAIDELGRVVIRRQMILADGLEGTTFLTNLVRMRPKEVWNLKAGQPPNLAAYFVLKDAADIFEWFTGLKATREVDRDSYKDTGPFWDFASALWPVVFGRGIEGLSSALKNWAHDSVQFDERSALIANIAMRNPTWGVFQT
jgi:hypothetical protein